MQSEKRATAPSHGCGDSLSLTFAQADDFVTICFQRVTELLSTYRTGAFFLCNDSRNLPWNPRA